MENQNRETEIAGITKLWVIYFDIKILSPSQGDVWAIQVGESYTVHLDNCFLQALFDIALGHIFQNGSSNASYPTCSYALCLCHPSSKRSSLFLSLSSSLNQMTSKIRIQGNNTVPVLAQACS